MVGRARRPGKTLGAILVSVMQSVRLRIQVPPDHRVELDLPPELPAGPAEVVVFSRAGRREPNELTKERLPQVRPQPLTEELVAARIRWGLMVNALRADPRPFHELSEAERRSRLERLLGAGRGLVSSSEQFARSKQEEIDLEEAKFARRR